MADARLRPALRPATVMIALALLLPGCAGEESGESEVVQVGSVVISSGQIEHRTAVEQAYGAGTLPPHTITVALVNDALEREVARLLGLLPTDAEVRDFRRHVEQTTRAPEVLRAVREVFGSDSAAFVRSFLEPRLISTKLLQYQRFDTTAQRDARSRIERAYALVAGGRSFADAAADVEGVVAIDTLGRAPNSADPSSRFDRSPSIGKEGMERIAQELDPGELFNQVLETEYVYRIARLLRREGPLTLLETLTVPKEEYSLWLQRTAAAIPIRFLDREIGSAVQREHPDVPWIGRVR